MSKVVEDLFSLVAKIKQGLRTSLVLIFKPNKLINVCFSLGGGEKAVQRHVSRNKMLPRDRINTLIDQGCVSNLDLELKLLWDPSICV